jgi:hypothetical protein
MANALLPDDKCGAVITKPDADQIVDSVAADLMAVDTEAPETEAVPDMTGAAAVCEAADMAGETVAAADGLSVEEADGDCEAAAAVSVQEDGQSPLPTPLVPGAEEGSPAATIEAVPEVPASEPKMEEAAPPRPR